MGEELEAAHGRFTEMSSYELLEMVKMLMAEYDKRTNQRFLSHEKEHEFLKRMADERDKRWLDAALASDKALTEARSVMERRLDGMNEFRAQLERAEQNYILKVSFDKDHEAVTERITALERGQWLMVGALTICAFVIPLVTHWLLKAP